MRKKVEELARKAEATTKDALKKMDSLLVKTAALCYQVSRFKDELVEEFTTMKKQDNA